MEIVMTACPDGYKITPVPLMPHRRPLLRALHSRPRTRQSVAGQTDTRILDIIQPSPMGESALGIPDTILHVDAVFHVGNLPVEHTRDHRDAVRPVPPLRPPVDVLNGKRLIGAAGRAHPGVLCIAVSAKPFRALARPDIPIVGRPGFDGVCRVFHRVVRYQSEDNLKELCWDPSRVRRGAEILERYGQERPPRLPRNCFRAAQRS